jgi:predicted NBD/HSP70 family sugar kinase
MQGIPTVSDNERLILDIIRRNEPIQRSQLSAQTPLTQPSVHRIIDNLIQKQLVLLGEKITHGPGKPSPELYLNRASHYAVGLVVNTDAISICLANLACESVCEISITDNFHSRNEALIRIRDEVQAMLAMTGATESNLVGVCLSIAGYFTGQKNQMNTSMPLQEWSLVDLEAVLSRYFEAPIFLENNGTAGAIGESLIGIGRWAPTFAYLSFNYGFGGGVIIDGNPYRGVHGNALEIGAIYDEYYEAMRPSLESLLKKLREHGVNIQTVTELQLAFDPNWPGVEEWVEETLPQLNQAIWAIRAIIDPEVIVFGGELPETLANIFIERASVYPNVQPRYGVHMPAPKLLYKEATWAGAALGAAIVPLKAHFY